MAQVLQRLGQAFVLIEIDQWRLEQAQAAGFPVIYGDATQELVLDAAPIPQARLVLITIPVTVITHTVVAQVRHLNPQVHIVARAEGVEQMKLLHEQGVYEVVQPEFEAGLEITRQALLHLSIPVGEIQRFTDQVRQELYAPLYQAHDEYQTITHLQMASRSLALNWITLPPDSPLAGQTIGALQIRGRTGASIVGVMRDGALHPNPSADYRFASGDRLAVIANGEQFDTFREVFGPDAAAK